MVCNQMLYLFYSNQMNAGPLPVQGCLYEGKPRLQVVSHHQQTSEEPFLSASQQPPQKSLVLLFQLIKGLHCQKSAQN